MTHLDVVQGFQEYCDRSPPVPEKLGSEFLKRIEPMGFRHFACCSHVNPSNPPPDAVVLHNYPPGWVRTFSQARLYEIDPVLRRAASTRVPFFWDTAFAANPLPRRQAKVLAEASSYGLVHGYTVPLHASWIPGSFRASCSVIPDSQMVDPASYVTIELLATYLYLFASRAHELWLTASRVELSLRERQCLELIADGKTDWETAQILGLSKSTAHTYVESAKRKIGVATRRQAAMYAFMTGQILCCRPSRTMTARAPQTRTLLGVPFKW